MAAFADVNFMLPDSSWSEISEDKALGNINIDADIYQITGRIDKQLGDCFIGLSTTYANTETEISEFSTQADTHTVTVTPYAAFVINDNFFISGFTRYSYSRSEPDTSGLGGITGIREWELNKLCIIAKVFVGLRSCSNRRITGYVTNVIKLSIKLLIMI